MSSYRPFRFGLEVRPAASKEEWATKARRAEESGYAILVLPDHLGEHFAPGPALQAAADVTTTLRLGSYVFDNDFRHPIVLAKEAATLDVLTGGRFELGLGAGWRASEYQQAGIPFDAANVRVERTEESLRIIKGLFSDGPVDFTGKYYTIRQQEGFPKPVQRPHPPILIGAGSQRMLSIAGREADIVSLNLRARGESLDMTSLEQKLTWVRQAAGDRFKELEFNLHTFAVVVTETPQEAAQQVATFMRAFIGATKGDAVTAEQVLASPHFLIGSVEHICEELLSSRETYGISYITVHERDRETFTPVMARLAGT